MKTGRWGARKILLSSKCNWLERCSRKVMVPEKSNQESATTLSIPALQKTYSYLSDYRDWVVMNFRKHLLVTVTEVHVLSRNSKLLHRCHTQTAVPEVCLRSYLYFTMDERPATTRNGKCANPRSNRELSGNTVTALLVYPNHSSPLQNDNAANWSVLPATSTSIVLTSPSHCGLSKCF